MTARDLRRQARTRARWPLVLVAAALVAGCGTAAGTPLPAMSSGSEPSPTSAATRLPAMLAPTTATPTATQSPVVEPTGSRTPTQAPIATPAPRPTPTARPSVTWTKFGAISTGSGGGVGGVTKVAGGYVAWGTYGKSSQDDPPFTTWFSTDGRSWARKIHAQSIVPCPGWTARPDLEGGTMATDGRTVVFTATLLQADDAKACDRVWMISLSTTDGRTWTRSQPFVTPDHLVWSQNTWAVPGSFETLVRTSGDAVTTWRSSDLATWTQIASRPGADDPALDFWVAGAAADGTRLAVSMEDKDGVRMSTLLSSTDAVNWGTVRVLPAGFSVVEVVPPSSSERPWLVAIMRDDPEEARVLVSKDLVSWKSAKFPKPGIRTLTPTPAGWIAVGLFPARETGCGDSCRPASPSLYSSTDGRKWIERRGSLPSETAGILGGDGAGEVLAANGPDAAGKVTLWRLTAGF